MGRKGKISPPPHELLRQVVEAIGVAEGADRDALD
jgi:hypothetical protein